VKFSQDGNELLDLETIYIIDSFDSPIYDNLIKRKCRILGPTALIQFAEQDASLPLKFSKYPPYCLHMRGAYVCFTGLRDKIEFVSEICIFHQDELLICLFSG
jgi:hypothetical protein